MNPIDTRERLLEEYNTFLERSTIENSKSKKLMFLAFQRTLKPFLPLDRSVKILDVACGEGALLAFLKEKEYVNLSGFDISPQNVAICHELGLNFVKQFDALKVSDFLNEQRFDVIFALDILEHIPKQTSAEFLLQIKNKLNPGGYVVIQTPNMGSILGCLYRYNDLSHEFGLTEKSALSLLKVAGFSPEQIEIRPAWNASKLSGYGREILLRFLHRLIFLTDGAGAPKIPTKNLLIRAFNK